MDPIAALIEANPCTVQVLRPAAAAYSPGANFDPNAAAALPEVTGSLCKVDAEGLGFKAVATLYLLTADLPAEVVPETWGVRAAGTDYVVAHVARRFFAGAQNGWKLQLRT
jgi:hypothetical protein